MLVCGAGYAFDQPPNRSVQVFVVPMHCCFVFQVLSARAFMSYITRGVFRYGFTRAKVNAAAAKHAHIVPSHPSLVSLPPCGGTRSPLRVGMQHNSPARARGYDCYSRAAFMFERWSLTVALS